VIDSYDNSGRQQPKPTKNVKPFSFRDNDKLLTEEQVKTETARCLGCGATIVDPNKCIGCGVCTTKCEFDAIYLNRERPECSKMVKSEDKMKSILPYMIKREIKIKKANRASKKSN
jgi:ferredoxin